MRKIYIVVFSIISLARLSAQEIPDSLSGHNIYLDEVVIVSNPKAEQREALSGGSCTRISSQQIQRGGIGSVKNISSLAPNLFIPDYGSRLTSAIYIRGIGTRTNSSVVGMYVDNVPYLDKSIYDTDLLDVESIEVLRGPQSTLYGRNTMGGIINIYTRSPFDYQFTKAIVSYSSYNTVRAAISHLGKISDEAAFSVSGDYRRSDGYFTNHYNDSSADESEQASLRSQFCWHPCDDMMVRLTGSYEYSSQNGYPYSQIEGGHTLPVNYDQPGHYKRILTTGNLYIENEFSGVKMTNATGYQFFDDRMDMDQDFTSASIFSLSQLQRQHSLSHEIVLRSDNDDKFQWLWGAFAFYQNLDVDAPVTFHKQGIDDLINSNIRIPEIQQGPMNIQLSDSLVNSSLPISGNFCTPAYGYATFCQLIYRDFLIKGLSLSAGLRVDYEKSQLDYQTFADAYAKGGVAVRRSGNLIADISFTDTVRVEYIGDENIDHLELLPRFDVSYAASSQASFYATLSKGYRAGGFNFQMFSDAVQSRLSADMISAFVARAESMGMADNIPEDIYQMAEIEDPDIQNLVVYKPEYSWNYEVGTRLNLLNNRLRIDASVFYIDVRNQQVTDFSDNGLGRITRNSGKSRSLGGELALRYSPLQRLGFSLNYGYTDARFVESHSSDEIYDDNHIPFAPEHTFSCAVNMNIPFSGGIDYLAFDVNYAGCGRIYWNEQNTQFQNFYATLGARLSAVKGSCELALWARNILDNEYQAFYFESLGRSFAQMGAPRCLGADFIVRF